MWIWTKSTTCSLEITTLSCLLDREQLSMPSIKSELSTWHPRRGKRWNSLSRNALKQLKNSLRNKSTWSCCKHGLTAIGRKRHRKQQNHQMQTNWISERTLFGLSHLLHLRAAEAERGLKTSIDTSRHAARQRPDSVRVLIILAYFYLHKWWLTS